MNIMELLCQPITCGAVMCLVTYLTLDFWHHILNKTYDKLPIELIKVVLALANGVMSYLAEVFTQNNASPRTIALYMPVMIMLQLHIIGRMRNVWGFISLLSLTSFQYITLYSVSLGLTYAFGDRAFLDSRIGLVFPVTLMNLLLSLFLLSIRIYRQYGKDTKRDKELGEILSSPSLSLGLIIYAIVNAVAVTVLTYDSIRMLEYANESGLFRNELTRNMILRDEILFFSTVLMLDIQARRLKEEKRAREHIEYEKRLRNSMHRNILFRFSCNVTTGVVIERGNLQIEAFRSDGELRYEDTVQLFLNLLVHPDNRDELREKMSIKNLTELAYAEKGFKYSMKISPGEFMNYITLDDDSAKIYAYIDREYIWTDIDCTVAIGENGDIYAYFYIMDIDEQKQSEEVLKLAASTDALTGVLNRTTLWKELDKYLTIDRNKCGALFMLDLDHFKDVNDTLGHPKGDELLKEVAAILVQTFRQGDLICRIGGDEFCAFAKGLTDIRLVKKRATELIEAGHKVLEGPDGQSVQVSFSIGIACIPDDAATVEELYNKADAALYNAKESGRDCFKVYSEQEGV